MENKKKIYIIICVTIIIILLSVILSCITKNMKRNEITDSDNIEIGDNKKIEETNPQNEDKHIIHYDDEIGSLTIPDISLVNAPIRESIELSTLSVAIGHFPSTSIYEGNVGLASHNYGNSGDFFKDLKNVKIGSEIFYQTNFGTKRYVVKIKETIDETNFDYLQETLDNRITLITCVNNNPSKRLCVQAVESSEGMDYGQ